MKAGVERRRFRRAEVDVPVAIRPGGAGSASAALIEGQVKDISLAGFYCYMKAPCALKPGDMVSCSMTIPQEQARWFPFTRVVGKGSVMRIEPVPMGRRAGDTPSEEELVGAAIAFTPDVTALGSISIGF